MTGGDEPPETPAPSDDARGRATRRWRSAQAGAAIAGGVALIGLLPEDSDPDPGLVPLFVVILLGAVALWGVAEIRVRAIAKWPEPAPSAAPSAPASLPPGVPPPPQSPSQPIATPRPPRNRKRLALGIGAGVIVVVVAFVVLGAVIDSHDPNQPASDDDVAAMKAQTTKLFDSWDLPPSVRRAPQPDRTWGYGYGGIQSVRHYRPAEGVTARQAAEDLVETLRAEGYHLEQDLNDDAAWDSEKDNCHLDGQDECGLYVEIKGIDPTLINVTFTN